MAFTSYVAAAVVAATPHAFLLDFSSVDANGGRNAFRWVCTVTAFDGTEQRQTMASSALATTESTRDSMRAAFEWGGWTVHDRGAAGFVIVAYKTSPARSVTVAGDDPLPTVRRLPFLIRP